MFEIIKPGTTFDFIGKRAFFFALSGVIIGASLIATFAIGLNYGIDFKGGTKIIVAFDASKNVERAAIKQAVDDMVVKETGKAGTQVEVQDFGTAERATEGQATRELKKYVLYTELTSLLTTEKRDAVAAAIKKQFGDQTLVDTPESGADEFYVTFPEGANIATRTQALTALLQAPPFAFAGVQVVSDKEREIEVDYVREVNLVETEVGAEGAAAASRAAFEERKEKMLADLADARYTITVAELKGKMAGLLEERFPDAFVEVESSTMVSAAVGEDLFANGILALLYSIIGMLIYITLRFDMRFAPGAIVALIHDALFTIGVFAIFQLKFTLPIIAAVLTIIGYSVNDTIVIFDRIRENMKKHPGMTLPAVINLSVNETLGRTILTSGATMLTVVAILVLGGGLIWDFALALFVGMISGVYSTVYIASPIALYLDRWVGAREAARKAAR